MKKIVFILSFVFFVVAGFSQNPVLIEEAKVPKVVLDGFKKKALKSQEIKWYKVKEGFMVKYKFAGQQEEVVYDKLANLIRSKVKMDLEKLPKVVIEDIESKHKDKEIEEVFIVTEGKKDKYYSIIMSEEVDDKDEPVMYEIQYTMQGKFITLYEPDENYADTDDEDDEEVVDKKTAKIENEAENLSKEMDGEKVKPKDLPSPILEYMKAHFDYQYQYKVCQIVQHEKFGEVYYIIMKKQGDKKQFIHYFDTNGKLIETSEE